MTSPARTPSVSPVLRLNPGQCAAFAEPVVLRVLLARLNQIPGVWARRQNTGMAKRGASTIVFGEPGQGDIVAVVRGLHVEIEAKSPTGRQSPAQVAYQRRLEAVGGIYLVARGEYQPTLDRVAALAGPR